jgi:hypothetical protein
MKIMNTLMNEKTKKTKTGKFPNNNDVSVYQVYRVPRGTKEADNQGVLVKYSDCKCKSCKSDLIPGFEFCIFCGDMNL